MPDKYFFIVCHLFISTIPFHMFDNLSECSSLFSFKLIGIAQKHVGMKIEDLNSLMILYTC